MICSLCPRKCRADRDKEFGFCRAGNSVKVARAALHFWEEPCISGDKGSGTIFFSGCTLGCIFCQNIEISRGETGIEISDERLIEIMFELKAKGAHNINFVTPDHYAVNISKCVKKAKERGLDIPAVMNTGGYISSPVYDLLKNVTDIWLTDYKFYSNDLAARYADAPDYPEVAFEALKKMVQDVGVPRYEDGLMKSGVIVRVLLLPGCVNDAKHIIRKLYSCFGDDVVFSLMNQYTPPADPLAEFPELNRRCTEKEYDRLLDYAVDLGIENAYIQEGDTAKESFIPAFDNTGVLPK